MKGSRVVLVNNAPQQKKQQSPISHSSPTSSACNEGTLHSQKQPISPYYNIFAVKNQASFNPGKVAPKTHTKKQKYFPRLLSLQAATAQNVQKKITDAVKEKASFHNEGTLHCQKICQQYNTADEGIGHMLLHCENQGYNSSPISHDNIDERDLHDDQIHRFRNRADQVRTLGVSGARALRQSHWLSKRKDNVDDSDLILSTLKKASVWVHVNDNNYIEEEDRYFFASLKNDIHIRNKYRLRLEKAVRSRDKDKRQDDHENKSNDNENIAMNPILEGENMDTNDHEEITSDQDHGNISDENKNSILAHYDPIRLAKYLHKKGTVHMGSSSQFDWWALGRQVGVCFNSLPPNVSFLYGLLDAEYIPNERNKVERHKEAHVERPRIIPPKGDQSHTVMESEHIGPYNGMFASNVNNAPFIIPDHVYGCDEDQDISNHDTSRKNSNQSHTAMESEHIGSYNGMFPSNVNSTPYSEDNTAEEAGEDSYSEDTEHSSLSRQVPYHTPPGDAWRGGGIVGGEGDDGDGGDGGDGRGQLESLKFPPHDWQNWKVFKKLFHCDFDGFSITGNPRILNPILGEFTQVIIPSYSGRVKPPTANTLLVTIYPFYIFVNEDFKSNIIRELNKIRRITHKPATKDNVLLFKSITMASPQFVRVIQRVGVTSVTVFGYGQKAPVNWGLKLMKAARNADIDCICEYDLAINIPPEKMHWARFDEHNMVPVRFDDRGNNTLNYVTLVACPRREGIEDIFGHNVKIFHWPIFTLSQLELSGFESIPIYGGFNVFPSRGGRFHQVPDVQIGDCFDLDDNHTVNHNLDWYDNDGESGLDLMCNQMTQKCNY